MRATVRFLVIFTVLTSLASCSTKPQSRSTVADAVSQRSASDPPPTRALAAPAAATNRRERSHGGSAPAEAAASISSGVSPAHDDAVIARINGRPVPASRLTNLLIRAHGAGLLEQIVVHDAAEQLAARRNLSVTSTDVDREYDLALRRLVDPGGLNEDEEFDCSLAEQLLTTLLTERNISRDEYMLGMKRNAYLRKLVDAEIVISESDLRVEFAAACAPRAQVCQIQVATLATVSLIQDALSRGDDFSALAERYSSNRASARLGGKLPPFSREDDRVPIAIRDAAFALRPGETSPPIRVGEWFHIVRLDAILPARELNFADVREGLDRRIRDRRAPMEMQRLFDRLLQNAGVEILDPVLRTEFKNRVRLRPDEARP